MRQLDSLRTHGLGNVGACKEIFEARQLIVEIEERLNPKPPVDLDAKAASLIARFGGADWVKSALSEADDDRACLEGEDVPA
jgi:hypothetical protein